MAYQKLHYELNKNNNLQTRPHTAPSAGIGMRKMLGYFF